MAQSTASQRMLQTATVVLGPEAPEGAAGLSEGRKPWKSANKIDRALEVRHFLPQTLSNLLIHVIFSTRDRASLINEKLRPDLIAYIGGIVRNIGGQLIAGGGTSDHAHLLIRLPAAVSVADAMRAVKANSSGWVREQNVDFAWQAGYGASSVSQSNAREVEKYILRQEDHHRRIGFREELILLLRKHNVNYDERYLWE
jgi:REP element-mobilizing transposase RayT